MSEKVKVITFFNEKGGTGKTTFTALFASWLAYKKHEKVYVFDMDFPMYQLVKMREYESGLLRTRPDCQFSKMAMQSIQWTYPIHEVAKQESFSDADLAKLTVSLQKLIEKAGGGYFLLDFPGRYLPNDPVHYFSRKGLIDLVIFPIDTDTQSRGSALYVNALMQRHYEIPGKRQDVVFLWNRESSKERSGKRDWYAEANRSFDVLGIPVIGARMRDIIITRRDASTFGFIRNTMCWPEANVAKSCPYLDAMFSEIKARADKKWNDEMKEMLYGNDRK